ncbi:TIGR04222 domain-containing membrane protein [Streptomyces sp. SAJ15]|uniref:TIGR04222 domain-containing membrane protein n=1 Tax=Streptomyces sp. SAJ15 TaxID=2011095 RepID=UPI0028CB756E|nr:TIGR04222 domain-containing membrane protein [Streptomyces sp. SAJ15]
MSVITTAGVSLAYVAVAAASVALARGTYRARRAAGAASDERAHDLMEAAFLAGGPGRVADTVLCGMCVDGRLSIGGPGVVSVRRSVARQPVEEALLQEYARAPHGAWAALRTALTCGPAVQGIGDRLAGRGLLVPPGAMRRWHRLGTLQTRVCGAALVLALVLSVVGGVADFGFAAFLSLLPALLGGAVAGAGCRTLAVRRITRAGRRALVAYRLESGYTGPGVGAGSRHGRARGGANGGGPGAATPAAVVVALGGPAALTYVPDLRDQLLQARRADAAATGSGSDVWTGVEIHVDWCGSTGDGGSGSDGGGGGGCGASFCGVSSSDGGGGDGGGGGSSCGGGCGGGGGGD